MATHCAGYSPDEEMQVPGTHGLKEASCCSSTTSALRRTTRQLAAAADALSRAGKVLRVETVRNLDGA